MLRSYLTSVARGAVVLRKEILEQIGIGPDGYLYGALHPAERAAILSPIPPGEWANAYKVIIHTKHKPGSVASATRAIREAGFNTVSSWVSCESHFGHNCCTSIVLLPKSDLDQMGGLPSAAGRIKERCGAVLSEAPLFESGSLEAVRVTPLSFLRGFQCGTQGAQSHTIRIQDNLLDLTVRPGPTTSSRSLWQELLTASDLTTATACILTPDTEEAFVRVALVPQPSRLYKIQFRIRIETATGAFQGYWEHALETLAGLQYSVYSAHNLMIEIGATSEEAEFTFIADAHLSPHIGIPVCDLRNELDRLVRASFEQFASGRAGKVQISNVRVTRPRGVGVPCFLATNAKPGDAKSAEVAVWLCRLLERNGFRPVNVDVAKGGVGLREQVKDLVAACSFMVVLHCPEEKLKLAASGAGYAHSPWVIHEEAMMFDKGGEILSLRFENVIEPAYQPGFVSVPIPLSGLDDETRQSIERRIERWTLSMHRFDEEHYLGPDIPAEIMDRDLVRYYSGGQGAVRTLDESVVGRFRADGSGGSAIEQDTAKKPA